eukprot:4570243-Alexandrium_andersonii.AAC.1
MPDPSPHNPPPLVLVLSSLASLALRALARPAAAQLEGRPKADEFDGGRASRLVESVQLGLS